MLSLSLSSTAICHTIGTPYSCIVCLAVVLAAGVADVSLEEEDDDAALEAMIAKELGDDKCHVLWSLLVW